MPPQTVVFQPSDLFGQFSYLDIGSFPNASQAAPLQPAQSVKGVVQTGHESVIAQQLGSEFDFNQATALGHLYSLTHNTLQASAELSDLTGTPRSLNTDPAHPLFTTAYVQRTVQDSNPSVLSATVTDNATLAVYNIQVTNPGTSTATYSVNSAVPVALVGNSFSLDSGKVLVRVNTSSDGIATLSVQPNVEALSEAIQRFAQAYNAELAFVTNNAALVTPDIRQSLVTAIEPQLSELAKLGITPQTGAPPGPTSPVPGALSIDTAKLQGALQGAGGLAIKDIFGGLQGAATNVGRVAATMLTSSPAEFSAAPASFVNKNRIFAFFGSPLGARAFAALSVATANPVDGGLVVNVVT